VRQLGEVLRLSAGYLSEHGSPTPRLDAELLIGHALGLPRIELYTNFDRPLDEPELAACRALLERRGRREPVAYILGRWGFHGLDLAVDARVLVPRPETEVLVERCLALLDGLDAPRVADVGTGSGAIALAIKAARPDAAVTATDVSPDALTVARANAAALGLELDLAEADLLAGVEGRFALVASNPPYIG
jgi:release factor glutamine methyltransferase